MFLGYVWELLCRQIWFRWVVEQWGVCACRRTRACVCARVYGLLETLRCDTYDPMHPILNICIYDIYQQIHHVKLESHYDTTTTNRNTTNPCLYFTALTVPQRAVHSGSVFNYLSLECSSLKYYQPTTAQFCTYHAMTCAKIRCDR